MKVERMLSLAEYKRRQAAPGVKVTLKNFGRDRRYPITNRFRDPGDGAAGARPHAAQEPGDRQGGRGGFLIFVAGRAALRRPNDRSGCLS